MKCPAAVPAPAAAACATGNSVSAHLHTLILAAGGSTRLGQPKQLVRIGQQAVLQRVGGAADGAGSGAVSMVLGAEAAQITPLFKNSSASILINRDWREGIAASIRCGLKSCGPGVDAVMILLGDQYAVTGADLKRLVDAWRGRQTLIAASLYDTQLGVPAIFPRWCFSELLELRGDQGAKLLIRRYADRVISVPMPNAALDLDTLEDLRRIGRENQGD